MLDAGASAENPLGGSHGRFSYAVSSVSPQHQKTVRALYISLYRLDSPSSVTIARNEWPDHRGCSIRRHGVRLRLNIRVHTCKLFSKDGGTSRWLSGSYSNADMFASSSPHLHGGRSALGPLVLLTSTPSKFIFFSMTPVANDCFRR